MDLPECKLGGKRREDRQGHRDIIQELEDLLRLKEEVFSQHCVPPTNAPSPGQAPIPGPRGGPEVGVLGPIVFIGLVCAACPECCAVIVPVL